MNKRYTAHKFFVIFLILLLTISLQILLPQKASAYNGGKLIENAAFLDAASMNKDTIQSFLVGKGAGLANMTFLLDCDAAGNQAKQIYLSLGAPCGQQALASHIIYYAAQVYGVSPKVVLATMQKEQSVVTAANPTTWQIERAMGYACPTTTGCQGSAGFFYQIDNGTWVLRFHYERARGNLNWWYTSTSWTCGSAKPTFYTPNLYPGQNVNFHDPYTNGTLYATIYIHNAATSAFYCYTPHTYNNPQGLYGLPQVGYTGSYYSGSYNFVRYYELWFDPGSTIVNNVTMNIVSQPDLTPAKGQTVSYTVSFTNNSTSNIVIDAVGIVGRAGSLNGANRDFTWQGPVTLQPGVLQQFTFTSLVRDTGMIYVWPAVNYQGAYVHYNNWGAALNSHQPNISLVTPFTSTVTNPVVGQTATLSATIKNNEDVAIDIDAIGIPARFHNTYSYDTGWVAIANPIAANGTQNVSGDIAFDKPGPYKAWVSGVITNQFTTFSSELNFNVVPPVPSFLLTYLETPNPSPALGEDVVVKFKLKNNTGVAMTLNAVGVVGRYDNPYSGPNNDFGWVGPVTFTVGEEKSFTSFVKNVSELKNFYAWVAINYQGSYIHYNNWGFMMTPRIPNLTLSAPLTINSGTTPTIGQTVPVTATVKNNEPKPIKFSAIGVPARYYGVYNYDVTWQGNGTLAAAGESGDSVSLSGNINFDKAGPYTVWTSINIQGKYITVGNPTSLNF